MVISADGFCFRVTATLFFAEQRAAASLFCLVNENLFVPLNILPGRLIVYINYNVSIQMILSQIN